jgi:hypothetical protein
MAITLYISAPAAPLTPWQRSERFATLRAIQRQAADLREELAFMLRYPLTYDTDDIRAGREALAQCEHLCLWLRDTVRPA